MKSTFWSKNPVEVIRAYESRNGKSGISPLLLWATWAVESLYYLSDLDNKAIDPSWINGHDPDVIDVAHARWATGTAITSLDLCAAVLGRVYYSHSGPNELDLRHFDPKSTKVRKDPKKHIKHLPFTALIWTENVLLDSRYKLIQGARNPLTHAWLGRTLTANRSKNHASRVQIQVFAKAPPTGTHDIVMQSKELASERVDEFVQVIDGL